MKASILSLLLLSAATASAQASSTRLAHSTQSQGGIVVEKAQTKAASQPDALRQLAARTTVESDDFWIYDASATLYRDYDNDGYYEGITLEFDADTIYEYADVYAVLYLGIGEHFYEYYTTSVFTLEWDSSDDALTVETDLVSGFPSGDYEVLIELYDAYDDTLVSTYDGYDDNDLVYLPLESDDYAQYVEHVTVSTEYGGSMGGWLMAGVGAIWLFRQRRQPQ